MLPISGYICYGGWKEPLVESYSSSKRSQNTFSSKVQALQSLSSTAKDGGHTGTDQVGGHYVVISAAETPHKRFCVRLIMDHDNSNVSLWANSRQCPPAAAASTMSTASAASAASNQPQYQLSNDRNDGLTNQNNGQLWSFNLTRTSKWFAKKQRIVSVGNRQL